MNYSSPYTPPTLTVDAVIFQLTHDELEVLLTQRGSEPFKGEWALPGGYNPAGSTTLEALAAVVKRKVGVDIDTQLAYIEQLYTFDTVARDPRGHCVSVTYMGCGRNISLGRGSQHAAFFPVDKLPGLAYDHADIIAYARERLAAKLTYTNAVAGLLDKKFTLSQLQTAYEAVVGRDIDKRNFRKKFLTLGLIHETPDMWREGAHRPAKLYAFNSESLEVLSRSFD
ncbi:NUDIX hydrolase [Candidatus Saccharibacteria bacterium]|nr:NUDIX hydrolase [Candidatus Saccharibacteria bacterium]